MVEMSAIVNAVNSAAPQFSINEVSLFGSYVRGDQGLSSDVDLAIRTGEGFSLLDASRFQRQISDALGVDVDIVSLNAATGLFAKNISEDRMVIYECA